MRIKKGFELRSLCGENMVIAYGEDNINFSKIITLNESAALLWNCIQKRDYTIGEMVEVLLKEYDIEKDKATEDVKELLHMWKDIKIIEE